MRDRARILSRNWKTDSCHFAFYELFPTIDHVVPISRGGEDEARNRVCTSMLRNAAKANFTIEELGWRMHAGQFTTMGWLNSLVPASAS
jgi:hypothetical protein